MGKNSVAVRGRLEIVKGTEVVKTYESNATLTSRASLLYEGETYSEMRRRGLLGVRDSDGMGVAVGEDEILGAYRRLSQEEGLFVEPSSAASVAAALQLGSSGQLARGSTVVCVSTASGLKDPQTAAQGLAEVPVIAPAFNEFERTVRSAYGARAEALLSAPACQPAGSAG
jgi:threonine synthase